jgi:hypothetical protein
MEKYSNIFGAPGTGVHAYRLFDFAIVDVLGTALVSYYVAKVYNYPVPQTMLLAFAFGHAMHLLFKVDTTLVKLLNK